jgi:hypothetical protein
MLSDFATLLRHNITKRLPTPGLDDRYLKVGIYISEPILGSCGYIPVRYVLCTLRFDLNEDECHLLRECKKFRN